MQGGTEGDVGKAKPKYWNGYLNNTLFATEPAVITFAPAIALFVLGRAMWQVGNIPALFIAWAWLGIADAICLSRDPVHFGLKLWFPPLGESKESLALVRSFIVADLALAAPRAAFGLWPHSPVLFVLAFGSVVIQLIWTVREFKHETIDIRVVNIAASGPVVLGLLLAIHAVLGGITWTQVP
jgi:hypothetical protein